MVLVQEACWWQAADVLKQAQLEWQLGLPSKRRGHLLALQSTSSGPCISPGYQPGWQGDADAASARCTLCKPGVGSLLSSQSMRSQRLPSRACLLAHQGYIVCSGEDGG